MHFEINSEIYIRVRLFQLFLTLWKPTSVIRHHMSKNVVSNKMQFQELMYDLDQALNKFYAFC